MVSLEMPRPSSLEIELTRHHCKAITWWLSEKFTPFAVEHWRQSHRSRWLLDLRRAKALEKQFARASKRVLKSAEQDRPAKRTVSRDDAHWLASQIDASKLGLAPMILPEFRFGFPDSETLARLPPRMAMELVFGLGTFEVMSLCNEKVHSRKVGRRRVIRTEQQVATLSVGDPAKGGDERYRRRLRRRAKLDKIATDIGTDFNRRMRSLEIKRED